MCSADQMYTTYVYIRHACKCIGVAITVRYEQPTKLQRTSPEPWFRPKETDRGHDDDDDDEPKTRGSLGGTTYLTVLV